MLRRCFASLPALASTFLILLTSAGAAPVTFVFTSDLHFGLTRSYFRGAANVAATEVNAALAAAINRVPAAGEARSNMHVGGRPEAVELSARDKEICAAIGPELKARGLIFAGIDVIGDYLTEINVTSPTCVRELDAAFNLDIAGDLMSCIAGKLGV